MKPSKFQVFYQQYKSYLFHLEAEEYLGWLTRFLPGFLGLLIRAIVHKLLLKKVESMIIIYPGVYLTHTYGITAGKSVSINTGAVLDGRGGISIGDYVMIGPNVCIASSNHHYKDRTIPVTLQGHHMEPVNIQADVWIGANATILGGVTIGKGAVVAAGAVVVKNVAEYSIVGGVPAKEIGHRE
jgi:acetyltransferase-like isoleucine patch superfamily enzyme